MTPTRDELSQAADKVVITNATGNPDLYRDAVANLISVARSAAALLCAHQAQAEPVARLLIGGISDNELNENDIEPIMPAVERLQEHLVGKLRMVDGAALDLYVAPPSSDQTWNEAQITAAMREIGLGQMAVEDLLRALARPSQAQEPSTTPSPAFDKLKNSGDPDLDPMMQPVSGAVDERAAFEDAATLHLTFAPVQNSQPVADTSADARDAARYRWLRAQNWNDGSLCVATRPRESVKLGFDCPSLHRLDDTIDAAIAASREAR